MCIGLGAIGAAMALLGAGISMEFGGMGPDMGNGMTAQGAVQWVSRNIEAAGELKRTTLVGQSFPSPGL
ncbi:MAG: F0F1 ATP synthase subunit C [Deltaproteobacteria bacterium]|nr:F0F1 ATP synthase subunit C [Deltaproteobacteria bacterium]